MFDLEYEKNDIFSIRINYKHIDLECLKRAQTISLDQNKGKESRSRSDRSLFLKVNFLNDKTVLVFILQNTIHIQEIQYIAN